MADSCAIQTFCDLPKFPAVRVETLQRDAIEAPYCGQFFRALEEAEECYRAYARKVGFGSRIRTTRRRAKSNEICSRLIGCNRAGNKTPECTKFVDGRGQGKSGATGCKARIFISHKKTENHWLVTSFEAAHNHPLVPSEVGHSYSRRKTTPVPRELIFITNQAETGAPTMVDVQSSQAAGDDNLGVTEAHIQNKIHNTLAAFDRNDLQDTLDFLARFQSRNLGFYKGIKLDDNGLINMIFWVDPRSRVAYQNFGDVVTFDTTYRTKYSMPFAVFTGLNHHHHPVFYGCALLRDKTEDSYVWLFETWLQAMYDCPPKTIITHQGLAVENAIARVLPNSVHHLCIWHLSNKHPEHLQHVYAVHPTFKNDFERCVEKSLTVEEFEEGWEKLMNDYSLHDENWLKRLYERKNQWVKAYTRKYFSAGLSTTSRREGMNSFDGNVSTTSTIKEFAVEMQKAIDQQCKSERDADHTTIYKDRQIILGSPLEMHAAKIYTNEMFQQFQLELHNSSKYTITKLHELCTLDMRVYALANPTQSALSSTSAETRRHFTVYYCLSSGFVKCNCQMFEHKGMICRHILRYFNQKKVFEIPKEYIIDRWTKGGKKVHGRITYMTQTMHDYEQSEALRYGHLCGLFSGIISKAASTMQGYKYLLDVAVRAEPIVAKFQLQHYIHKSGVGNGQESSVGSNNEEASTNPSALNNVSQTKGRTRAMRMKSPTAEATGQKRLRKCALCDKLTDHDKRNHYKALGLTSKGLLGPSNEDEPIVGSSDEEASINASALNFVSQTKRQKLAMRMMSPTAEATGQNNLRKCALCNKLTDHDKRNHYKALGLTPKGVLDLSDEEEPNVGSSDGEASSNASSVNFVFQTEGRKLATRVKSPTAEAAEQKNLRKCALCDKLTYHDKRNHYKALGLISKRSIGSIR